MTRPLTLMVRDEDRFFAGGIIAWFHAQADAAGQLVKVISSLEEAEGPVLVFFTLRTSITLPPALFMRPDSGHRLVCITTRQLWHTTTLPGFPWIPLLFRDTYTGGLPKPSQPAGSAPRLTRRRLEVLRYLAAGMSAREAAERLGISAQAFSCHKHNAMIALGLRNNQALRLWLAGPGSAWLSGDGYGCSNREERNNAA